MTTPTRFLALDTETTGFMPNGRVCEVAWVLFQEDAIVDSGSTLVNPERDSTPEAFACHRITKKDLLNAPKYQEILPHLCTLMDKANFVIAHNAKFDRDMLPGLPTKRWICTLEMARLFFGKKNGNSLEALTEKLNLTSVITSKDDNHRPHRALYDVGVTVSLFWHFQKLSSYDPSLLSYVITKPKSSQVERSSDVTSVSSKVVTSMEHWSKDVNKGGTRIGRKWSKQEDEDFTVAYTKGDTVEELMVKHNRNLGGITARAKMFGLPPREGVSMKKDDKIEVNRKRLTLTEVRQCNRAGIKYSRENGVYYSLGERRLR